MLLIIDTADDMDTPSLFYVDPLDGKIPPDLNNALSKQYPESLITSLEERIQYESIHCGTWCAHIAQCYIEHCRTSANKFGFTLRSEMISINSGDLEKQNRNTAFIVGQRLMFMNIIEY